MITIRKQEEMEKYYIKEMCTYCFEDDVEFKCDIEVHAHISAFKLYALSIIAWDIKVCGITAKNLEVWDIDVSEYGIVAEDINATDIYSAGNVKCGKIIAYDIRVPFNITAKEIRGNKILCGNITVEGLIFGSLIEVNNIHANKIYAEYMIARNVFTEELKGYDIFADLIEAEDIEVSKRISVFSNIQARDIKALSISAGSINAHDIIYGSTCVVAHNIECNTIKPKDDNERHIAFGKLIIKGE